MNSNPINFKFKKRKNFVTGENEYVFSLSKIKEDSSERPKLIEISNLRNNNPAPIIEVNREALNFYTATKHLTQIKLEAFAIEKLLNN